MLKFLAFACNTKSFAIAFIFFSPLPFCRCFRNGLVKVFLRIFQHSLPRRRVTKIRLVSLDTLGNIFLMICSLLHQSFHSVNLTLFTKRSKNSQKFVNKMKDGRRFKHQKKVISNKSYNVLNVYTKSRCIKSYGRIIK